MEDMSDLIKPGLPGLLVIIQSGNNAIKSISGDDMIDSSVKVTVPSTVDVSKGASQELIDSEVDHVLAVLSELFGGATAIEGRGGYVDEQGRLITEKVVVIEALCEKQSAHFQADQVMDLGAQICESMSQECVLVQIDGVAHFVDESHRLPGLCGTAPMPIAQ